MSRKSILPTLILTVLCLGLWSCGAKPAPKKKAPAKKTAKSAKAAKAAETAAAASATTETNADVTASLHQGMTMDEVQAVLGPPQGKFSAQGKTHWIYERGSLVFRDDKLTYMELLSDQEMAEKRAAEAKAKAKKKGKPASGKRLKLPPAESGSADPEPGEPRPSVAGAA